MTDKHILIVDDEQDNLDLLRNILDIAGYSIVTALNGESALKKAHEVLPVLVVLDAMMPNVDGFEICKQFKADADLQAIPIIFISALDSTEDRLKGFKVGGVDYITRPFYPTEVFARIKAHLELQTIHRQLQVNNKQLQQEVQQRKKAEENLLENERRYRSLFEKTNNAVFIIGMDYKLIEVNRQASELLGYSADELVGRHMNDFTVDTEATNTKQQIERLTAGELLQPYERTFAHKDGTTFVAEVNVTLIRDDDEKPIYFHSVVRELTEQKKLQRELQESEKRYRLILENTSEGVFTTDILGYFTFVNPVIAERSGYTVETLVGRHFSDLIDETWHEPVLRFYQDQLENRTTEAMMSFPLKERNGKQIWVEQTTNLVMNGDKITGFIGVGRDITDRKLIEAERERLIAELDAFAHTVAHDLKMPLTNLTVNSDMLSSMFERLSEEKRESAVERIQVSARKMADIIDALLLLASVRKQEDIEISTLDMRHIIEETKERLKSNLQASKAVCTVPDTLPSARGYAPWVEEVWVNYFSNALKYGGNPPEIIVTAEALPDGFVRYSVKDNGAGLSAKDQENLFMPFFRLNHGKVEGHGLGLSIVQRIVERLGGTSGVESKVGDGSTFYFTLPNA